MKTFEKVTLLSILISFIAVLLFGYWLITSLFLSLFCLFLIYIFGGFYFFNIHNKKKAIPIISGIILATGVFTLFFAGSTPAVTSIKTMVISNIVFTVFLLVFWVIKRDKYLKFIFYRSTVISLLTSFFAFSSIENSFYRNTVKKINDPKSNLYSNLLMFDEIELHNDFISNNNYDKAINAAKKAIDHGKKWKNYDTLYYKNFSGVYEILAKAYQKKGHQLYEVDNFDQALINYTKADSMFNHKEYKPSFPESNRSKVYWNRWSILKTYNRLDEYEKYDQELDFLNDNFLKVKDSIDIDYYNIIENVSNNYTKRSLYEDAIYLDKFSLTILKKDSINNIDLYKDNYERLIKNYIINDSLKMAKNYLDKYEKIASNDDCPYLFYKTSYLKKKNITDAKAIAQKACVCFSKKENTTNIFEANLFLAIIELDISNFSNFEKQIGYLKSLIPQIDQPDYRENKINKLLGHFYFIKGDYKKSNLFYQEAIDYYNKNKIHDIESILIELNIANNNEELNLKYDKVLLNSKTLNEISNYDFIPPSLTPIHNSLANINILNKENLSDSLLNITLKSHKKYDIKYATEIGIAYNGLGLIQLKNKNYTKADSLFLKAISQFNYQFKKNRTLNQLFTYLNLAESKFQQNKLKESKEYLNLVKSTKTNCFKEEQTIYDAYILELEGDILSSDSSKINLNTVIKYRQALIICQRFFFDSHPFVINLKSKMK